jgi:hypothetical protein
VQVPQLVELEDRFCSQSPGRVSYQPAGIGGRLRVGRSAALLCVGLLVGSSQPRPRTCAGVGYGAASVTGAAAAGAAAIVLAIAAGTMVHHPATSRSAVCHGCEAQSHCWCPPHMRVHSLQQIAHCSAYAAPSSRSRADQIPAVGSRWIPHSNPMAYQPDISG